MFLLRGWEFIHFEGILNIQKINFSKGRQQVQLKHMQFTIKDQGKFILIEIKSLRPSVEIKFIEIRLKEVESINLIKIQVNRPFFTNYRSKGIIYLFIS